MPCRVDIKTKIVENIGPRRTSCRSSERMPAGAKPDARGICVYSASRRVNANAILARRPARSPIRTAEILARA